MTTVQRAILIAVSILSLAAPGAYANNHTLRGVVQLGDEDTNGTLSTNINDEENVRYIVKFKEGSNLYKQRLDEHRRRKMTEDHADLKDYFLVPDNAEVMILRTEEEVKNMVENEEVEYVEKGKMGEQ